MKGMERANIIGLITKLGTKLLFTLFKSFKVVKLFLFGSSFVAYSLVFTWKFAVMIVGMIFLHELGHVWAMKRMGIKTKGIYFVPFLGAASVADELFKTKKQEVIIAVMGPIWGFFVALATASLYFITKNPILAAGAGWMALVNLINLLPINPLDGGRIVKSIAFSIHNWIGFVMLVLGMIASIVITFMLGMWLFAIIFLVGGLELIFEAKFKYNSKMPKLGWKGILASVGVYFMIIAVLWGLMGFINHVPEVDFAMELLRG